MMVVVDHVTDVTDVTDVPNCCLFHIMNPSVFRHIFKIQLCLMSDIKKLMNSWITQLQQPTKT
jgi:hypothetical protein